MAIIIKVDPPKIPKGLLGKTPGRILNLEARLAVNRGVTIMLRSARTATPVRTGKLRNAWKREKAKTLRGVTEGAAVNDFKVKGKSLALILERGTRKNPFPPVTTTSEPALAPWMRLKNDFFVMDRVPGGGFARRSANLSVRRDMLKVAFKIGGQIKKTGRPKTRAERGRFKRSVKRVIPKIEKEFEKMIKRIAAKVLKA